MGEMPLPSMLPIFEINYNDESGSVAIIYNKNNGDIHSKAPVERN